MAYIGKGFKDIATANIAVNTMVGDGIDTTLGLSMGSKGVGSVNDVSVFVGGIQQRPGTDFTLSGSTITFTTAPANGVKVVAMSHGDSWNNAPSDNTITPAKLKDASVTSDKIIGLDAGKLSGSLSGSGVNLTNLNAANISGTLPAIDGSALTGISAYENETSDPTATSNKTLGTMWVNKTSGEMYILTDDTTNANVWTNVGGGTGNIPVVPVSLATGGTVTTVGNYKVHTFTTSSTINFSVADAPVDYLVIAGGGGGGGNIGGGGGAGGCRQSWNSEVSGGGASSETNLAMQTGTVYTVTVGAGGAGASGSASSRGSNGTVTSIAGTGITNVTTAGGGGGGTYNSAGAGLAGGSGGGGGSTDGGGSAGGAGTSNQGFAGAAGGFYSSTVSGGGGGSAAVGTSNGNVGNGYGGAGIISTINGTTYNWAGGGGAAAYGGDAAQGGIGGGGGGAKNGTVVSGGGNAINNGADTSGGKVGGAGGANVGGGGGGGDYGGYPPSGGLGGSGGSGVVILRYRFQ